MYFGHWSHLRFRKFVLLLFCWLQSSWVHQSYFILKCSSFSSLHHIQMILVKCFFLKTPRCHGSCANISWLIVVAFIVDAARYSGTVVLWIRFEWKNSSSAVVYQWFFFSVLFQKQNHRINNFVVMTSLGWLFLQAISCSMFY